MVTTGAILRGDQNDIAYGQSSTPSRFSSAAAQALTACARIAQDLGYDEVNINVAVSDR